MKLLDKLDEKLNKFFEKTFGEGFERLGKTVEGISSYEGNSSSTVRMNGVTIEVKNGKMKVNGKDVPIEKPSTNQKKEAGEETFLREGTTKTVHGDIVGNVTFNGNNITVIIEGDVCGNIYGASKVNVQGDHIGNS